MSESPALKTSAERLQNLEALLSGIRSSSETRLSRRLRMNRAGNLLFGVALHAASRQASGQQLTELEQRLLARVGKMIPPEELPALGQLYAAARARGSISIFPEPITRLSMSQGYSDADLRADLPALGREIMAQPNFSKVDVSKLGAGESLDTEAFSAALADYGGGMTLVTGAPLDASARATPMNVTVRLASFKCVESSGDGAFNTKDEIYWGLSAGADSRAKTSSKTREYGSIKDGSHPSFDSGTNLFAGTVDQHLSCQIQCWEADDSNGGFYNSLRSALADFAEACIDASVELAQADDEAEKAAAWGALIAIGAGLLNWVLGLVTNDDDLVCERTIGFDRAALHEFSNRGENGWYFNGGGGGRHTLYLRFNDVDTTDRRLYHSVLNGNSWSASVPFPSDTTDKRPALAAYNGKLHCMFRGQGNENLYHGTFDGNSWSPFTHLDGLATTEAPAIAEFNGKLYTAHLSGSGGYGLYWNYFDGASWSGAAKLPIPLESFGGSAKGPALAVSGGKLYCVIRPSLGESLLWAAFNGTSWTSWAMVGSDVTSAESPALADLNGKLYCLWRGGSGGYGLYWNSFNGTSWSAANKIPYAATSESPALVAFDGKLHCIHRSDKSEELYHATFNGNSWTAFTKLSLTSSTTPALAGFKDKLYCVHRG